MIRSFLKQVVTSKYLALAFRIGVGGFFLYASLSKIPYPAQFAEATADYRLVPYWLLNPTAVVLPWVEFVCALFLIIGFASRASAVLIGTDADYVRYHGPDQYVLGGPHLLRVLRYGGRAHRLA